MDKFKEKTMNDYTATDITVNIVCMKHKTRRQFKKIFKRKARTNLKRDLRKEM